MKTSPAEVVRGPVRRVALTVEAGRRDRIPRDRRSTAGGSVPRRFGNQRVRFLAGPPGGKAHAVHVRTPRSLTVPRLTVSLHLRVCQPSPRTGSGWPTRQAPATASHRSAAAARRADEGAPWLQRGQSGSCDRGFEQGLMDDRTGRPPPATRTSRQAGGTPPALLACPRLRRREPPAARTGVTLLPRRRVRFSGRAASRERPTVLGLAYRLLFEALKQPPARSRPARTAPTTSSRPPSTAPPTQCRRALTIVTGSPDIVPGIATVGDRHREPISLWRGFFPEPGPDARKAVRVYRGGEPHQNEGLLTPASRQRLPWADPYPGSGQSGGLLTLAPDCPMRI